MGRLEQFPPSSGRPQPPLTISAQLAEQLATEPTHDLSPMQASQASALASYLSSLAALARQVSLHLPTL